MNVKSYIVRRGDTFNALATQCNVSALELIRLNPEIKKPNLVRSGSRLFIPENTSVISIHSRLTQDNYPYDAPEWLKIACREEGVAELEGPDNNTRIP